MEKTINKDDKLITAMRTSLVEAGKISPIKGATLSDNEIIARINTNYERGVNQFFYMFAEVSDREFKIFETFKIYKNIG